MGAAQVNNGSGQKLPGGNVDAGSSLLVRLDVIRTSRTGLSAQARSGPAGPIVMVVRDHDGIRSTP
jgi:hypothetical protein